MVQEVKFPERKDIPSTQKKKEVDKEQQGFSQLFDRVIESEEPVVTNTPIKNNNDGCSQKNEEVAQKEDNVFSSKEDGVAIEEKEVCKDKTPLHVLQNLVAEQFQFQFKNEGISDGQLEEQIVNISEISVLNEESVVDPIGEMLVGKEQENLVFSQGENIDGQTIVPKKDKKQNFVEETNTAGTKMDQVEESSVVINKKIDKVEETKTVPLKVEEFNQQNLKVEKQNKLDTWSDSDELKDGYENNILSQKFIQERIGDYPKENIKVVPDTQILQSTEQVSDEIFARNGIELRENIVEKMTQSLAQNKYELELTLNPEHLGKMSIRISYVNEKATVAILCSSKEASQMLAEQAKEIGRIMEQHLKADTFIAVDSKEQDYLDQNLEQSKEQHTHQENKQKKKTYGTQEETQTFMEQLRLGLA